MTPPMQKPPTPSLFRAVRVTLAANIIFALSQWLVIIVVARLGSPAQVGYITLATAIVTPAFAMTGMSLREARAVDVGSRFSDTDYYALRFYSTLIAVLASLAIVLFAYAGEARAFVFAALAFIVTKIPHVQSTLSYGVMQAHDRFDLIFKSNCARAIGGVIAFAAVFYASGNLALAFLAQALVWGVTVLRLERPALSRLGAGVSWAEVRAVPFTQITGIVLWILPLSVAGVLTMLSRATPRVALGEYVSFEALGIFGATFYLLTATQLLTVAVGQAAVSRMARAHQRGDSTEFWRTTSYVLAGCLALGAAVIVLGYLLGPAVISAIYGSAYVDFYLIMAVSIAVALSLLNSVAQFSLTARNSFRLKLFVNFSGFIAAILLSFWLIPAGGIHGAAQVLVGTLILRILVSFPLLVWAYHRGETTLHVDPT